MIRIALFLVGLVSLTLLIVWVVGGFFFFMGSSPDHGAVAHIPRWVFGLSIFVIFYGSKPVKRFFTKMEKVLF